ncbi:MAG: Do family serine endopeptidase [Gammaproteobacteria bacterium]|nr:Do family serine endopeptidase [Gammaproteobacteria bacterium]
MRKTVLASAIAVTLGLGALGAGQAIGAAASQTSPASLSSSSPIVDAGSFRTLAKQVRPAVVNISTEGKGAAHGRAANRLPPPFRRFAEPGFGQAERTVRAVGSGFIVDARGYVLTNDHVIRDAEKIVVTMDDGRKLDASVVGRDPRTDLAVLKLVPNAGSQTTFPYVELGDSDKTEVGDWVVAVGNPFGLGGTFTAGILSARGRDIQSGPYDDYLQIDAPINRGSSGGPLFDTTGKVVGINTAIFSPTGGNVGIGFAVPARMAQPILDEIIAKGFVDRGWIGVHIQPVTDAIASALSLNDTRGALVANVAPSSPADAAGIEVGDLISAVDGRRLEDFRDLSKLVGAADAGDEMTLTVMRDGKTLSLTATLGALPGAAEETRSAQPPEAPPRLGLHVVPMTPQSRGEWGVKDGIDGALVAKVAPSSPAARAGLRAGDVIVEANSRAVDGLDALRDVLSKADTKRPVLLLVARGGAQRFVTVDLS